MPPKVRFLETLIKSTPLKIWLPPAQNQSILPGLPLHPQDRESKRFSVLCGSASCSPAPRSVWDQYGMTIWFCHQQLCPVRCFCEAKTHRRTGGRASLRPAAAYPPEAPRVAQGRALPHLLFKSLQNAVKPHFAAARHQDGGHAAAALKVKHKLLCFAMVLRISKLSEIMDKLC